MELTDEELVARYRASVGTPQSDRWIDQLFRRHHVRVGTWCYRLTGDRESAADLAQEVFLKAYQHMASFRGHSKFSTWLYSIARNHCMSEMKARSAHPQEAGEELLLDVPDQREADPHSIVERESSARRMRELMRDSLDELETRVLTLHYAEDLPLDAITRLLGLTNASGAKAYIVSAKRKLIRAFQREKAISP